MKNFILKLALFTAGLLALFLLITLYYNQRIKKQDNFILSMERFKRPDVQPVVVFLGDSRPAVGIRNKCVSKEFYNLSTPGEAWRMTFLKAKYALKIKKSIRYFVIQVDEHILSTYKARDMDFTNAINFSSLNDIQRVYPYPKIEMLILLRFPILSANNRITLLTVFMKDITCYVTRNKNIRTMAIDSFDDLNFQQQHVWTETPKKQRSNQSRERVKMLLSQPLTDPGLSQVFNDFLDLCRKNKIQVLGIRYPVSREFQKFSSAYPVQSAEKVYAGQPILKILDYRNIFNKKQRYFYDTDHLNSKGACIFSKKVFDDIEKLISPAPWSRKYLIRSALFP